MGSGSWVSCWERRKRIYSWRHIVLSTSFIWPVKRFIFLSYSLCFLAGVPFVAHLSVQTQASPGCQKPSPSMCPPLLQQLPFVDAIVLFSSVSLDSKSNALFLPVHSGGNVPFTEKICISGSSSYLLSCHGHHSEFVLWILPLSLYSDCAYSLFRGTWNICKHLIFILKENKILFPPQTRPFRGMRFYVVPVHSNSVARGLYFCRISFSWGLILTFVNVFSEEKAEHWKKNQTPLPPSLFTLL